MCGDKWKEAMEMSNGRSGCCDAGSYMSDPMSNPFSKINSCDACPAGTYTSELNDDTSCEACPLGKSSVPGSSSISSCRRSGTPVPDCTPLAWDDRSCGLRKVVDDWTSGDISKKNAVLEKFGRLEFWNVSQIRNMGNLFRDKKLFNGDVSKWIVSKATDMNRSKSPVCPKSIIYNRFESTFILFFNLLTSTK